jgi:hypothetical protein
MRYVDLTGKRFGKLVAMEHCYDKERRITLWKCKCDCGNTVAVRASQLVHGRSKSCGCLRAESNLEHKTTHGRSGTSLYAVWNGMKGRCYNPNNHNYARYGARGICVCDEWKASFEEFYMWAMNNGYEDGMSIDRIDNNGNYCPDNCRWADIKTQNNNRRISLMYTYNGKTQNLSSWCEELGLPYLRTWQRIVQYGYSFEEAILLPKNKQRKKPKTKE